MNSYYVMIRFEGAYVDGYFVPQAKNEEQALTILKKLIVSQIIIARKKIENGSAVNHIIPHINRLKSHYRSLKRPWRRIDRDWKDKKRKTLVVSILNWPLPVETGFWLKMVGTETHLCNLPGANWEPRPKITG